MTEKKMTESEIMKALKCLTKQNSTPDDREKCFFMWKEESCFNCHHTVAKNAIDLINRKNAEIERVTKERDNITKTYTEVFDAWQITRAEAIKEFAERVKETFPNNSHWVRPREIIDQIAKEMGVEL